MTSKDGNIMKETELELFNDWWVMLWFIFGIVFFVLATIAAANNETDKSIACIAICNACHARCEVKILARKIDKIK